MAEYSLLHPRSEFRKVFSVGGSLCAVLPAELINDWNIKEGDLLVWERRRKKLICSPLKNYLISYRKDPKRNNIS